MFSIPISSSNFPRRTIQRWTLSCLRRFACVRIYENGFTGFLIKKFHRTSFYLTNIICAGNFDLSYHHVFFLELTLSNYTLLWVDIPYMKLVLLKYVCLSEIEIPPECMTYSEGL